MKAIKINEIRKMNSPKMKIMIRITEINKDNRAKTKIKK